MVVKCIVYEFYELYSDGRIFSFLKNRFLKPYTGENGYPYFTLKGKAYYIHRLLGTYFIPNPDNKSQINHIDGNRSNCDLSNLEWVTPRENIIHSYQKLGRTKVGSYNHTNSKLIKEQIEEIFNSKESQRKTAEKYGVSARTIFNIRKGLHHTWAQGGNRTCAA